MDFSYIDTHGHINDAAFDQDRDEVIVRLREANIATTIVGTAKEMSRKAIALASREEGRYAIIGQHPYDEYAEDFDEAQYKEWAMDDRVVAIGECGLDYFWPAQEGWRHGENEEKERQRILFQKQLKLAEEVGKPVVIHGRPNKGTMDAYEDILLMLKERNVLGVAHFFAGDIDIAKRFLDIGFYCSFTGVLTFVRDYDEVVRYIPKDRILPETDSPYVAPKPYRGKRNEPSYVTEVYTAIAEIRGEERETMRIQLNTNAHTFFRI